ncbi:hypothetical protein LCGC14_1895710 [marine sediment metagenome]|uniref:Ferritin-like diiron domain-containing protein n=1 Tax=marine sediment metagenome TaxID=412755 RepID=A0A0F9GLH3_9ZZZZ
MAEKDNPFARDLDRLSKMFAGGRLGDHLLYGGHPQANVELLKRTLILELEAVLPDEGKAQREYRLMAQQMRQLGLEEFAKQLEIIANQEGGHHVSVQRMLEYLQ